ncbi:hypothetical protein ABIC10_008161 [Bradyrhizobium sp. S3.2.12]
MAHPSRRVSGAEVQPYIIEDGHAIVNVGEAWKKKQGIRAAPRDRSESVRTLPANVHNDVKYTGGAKAERTLF